MRVRCQQCVASVLQKKLPPVRNKDYKTKMRERKKKKKEPTGNGDAKAEEPKEAPRIKGYDYRSWDKFDVVADASLKHILTMIGEAME